MANSELSSIPSTLLFRFQVPCQYADLSWKKSGVALGEEYQLPLFCELQKQKPFADVRAAWNEKGLFFDVSVSGKQLKTDSDITRPIASDCFQVWIDTRNVHEVHRATRFCHWISFLPAGAPGQTSQPCGTMLKINRAQKTPGTFAHFRPNVHSDIRNDGYRMQAYIDKVALDGWDDEYPRQLGFMYLVHDQELGEQFLAGNSDFPVAEDPSLWSTMELIS